MTMAEQPHETVWRLSTAGFAARCLHLVADLGVADRIADGPVPVTYLADSCAVKADALDRVLDGLAQLEALGFRFRLIESDCR